jgi:hypothetical protein
VNRLIDHAVAFELAIDRFGATFYIFVMASGAFCQTEQGNLQMPLASNDLSGGRR